MSITTLTGEDFNAMIERYAKAQNWVLISPDGRVWGCRDIAHVARVVTSVAIEHPDTRDLSGLVGSFKPET